MHAYENIEAETKWVNAIANQRQTVAILPLARANLCNRWRLRSLHRPHVEHA